MKLLYTQLNIGKAKYTISYHDGETFHKDGSQFFGIKIFSNKIKFEKELKHMIKDGYSFK